MEQINVEIGLNLLISKAQTVYNTVTEGWTPSCVCFLLNPGLLESKDVK